MAVGGVTALTATHRNSGFRGDTCGRPASHAASGTRPSGSGNALAARVAASRIDLRGPSTAARSWLAGLGSSRSVKRPSEDSSPAPGRPAARPPPSAGSSTVRSGCLRPQCRASRAPPRSGWLQPLHATPGRDPGRTDEPATEGQGCCCCAAQVDARSQVRRRCVATCARARLAIVQGDCMPRSWGGRRRPRLKIRCSRRARRDHRGLARCRLALARARCVLRRSTCSFSWHGLSSGRER